MKGFTNFKTASLNLKAVSFFLRLCFVSFTLVGLHFSAKAAPQDLTRRLDDTVNQGQPLVAHVVVALCDNKSQGIFPVSPSLGDGDSPRTNLYWGALYGVKTYFSKHSDWQRLQTEKPTNPKILERVVFVRNIERQGKTGKVILVADAWQGKYIQTAIEHFLQMTSGGLTEEIKVVDGSSAYALNAGGAAHLAAYVGHNGLMEFSVASPANSKAPLNNAAIVLACESDAYFSKHLQSAGAFKLLTTTGLMAPEAYTLEAAISTWFSGRGADQTHDAAARAYSQYQKANLSWAKRLFVSGNE